MSSIQSNLDTLKRSAKIICTVGPASADPNIIKQMIDSGADVCRINFSHHDADWHRKVVKKIRQASKAKEKTIAIIADLQGPKIRTLTFEQGSVELIVGEQFIISTAIEDGTGHAGGVGISYLALIEDCKVGDTLALSDGCILLDIIDKTKTDLVCKVQAGGILKNRQGINLLGGGLSADALTTKDLYDIKLAAELGVDYLAVSFVSKAEDIEYARSLAQKAGSNCGIIAKIEKAEVALNDDILQSVIKVSDAVMIARGDLGVEIGNAALVGVQKHIIKSCIKLNRPVITATQMLESMINNPRPTRAEVSDVANAVLDGSDAVMLSAETASGSYPVEAVRCMVEVICGAENSLTTNMVDLLSHRPDDIVAASASYAANHLKGVASIVCITASGYTARIMSRMHCSVPIIALSPNIETLYKVSLYKGVHGLMMAPTQPITDIISRLKKMQVIEVGSQVIITNGNLVEEGCTSSMKIIVIE